jgi:2-iminobutanoate/2-iminopropanoate deaminase
MDVVGDTIEVQTERTLKNIEIVLGELGLSLQNVVKSTVFLKDMDDFQGMNEVYARIFHPHRPARSTVAVRQIPLNVLVEIECIAEISAEKAIP